MKSLLLSVIFIVFSFFQVEAQNQPRVYKFGYVDIVAVLNNLPEYKLAQTSLRTHREKYGQQLAVKEQYLQGKLDEYRNDMTQGKLPAEEQKTRETELMKLQQEIQTFRETLETTLIKKEEELITPIADKIQASIEAVATEEGYSYIFSKSATEKVTLNGLLRGPKEEDITQKIAKKLNIVIEKTPAGGATPNKD